MTNANMNIEMEMEMVLEEETLREQIYRAVINRQECEHELKENLKALGAAVEETYDLIGDIALNTYIEEMRQADSTKDALLVFKRMKYLTELLMDQARVLFNQKYKVIDTRENLERFTEEEEALYKKFARKELFNE